MTGFVSENIQFCFMFATCKVKHQSEMILEEEWLAITITSKRLGVYPLDS